MRQDQAVWESQKERGRGPLSAFQLLMVKVQLSELA